MWESATGGIPMVDRLGKYEIIRTLGHGAMGEVYLAHHPVIGREVAIKTILPAAAQGEDAEARFRREATAAGKLNHPNLVTIYDFDKDGDVLYIVMEFVRGEDLEELIRERDLTHAQFLEVLAQVCDGLAYAHKAGIIHRDIKPANVRVTRDGKRLLAKVMDFGIARTEDSNMTNTGIVMGTVSYMAPEYIQTGKATVQADLWAVGVMLYECLSGRKPFHAENTTTVLFKIVSEMPRPIEPAEIHGISPVVRAVLERALAKDPTKRFYSADEFAKALRACKDPTWSGQAEGGLTMVVNRQEAAQAISEASGILPTSTAVPAPPTAPVTPTGTAVSQVSPQQATTMLNAPVAEEGTVRLGTPAPPTVVLPPAPPATPVPPPEAPAPVPLAARPRPMPQPTPPPPSRQGRSKGLLLGGAAAVALLVIIGGWALLGRKGTSDAPPAPTTQTPPQLAPAAETPVPTASGETPQTTPEVAPGAKAKVDAAATKPGAANPPAVTKAEPPKPEPGKTEPAKPADETPEQRLSKALALMDSDPRAASQLLKPLAYAAPTSQDPKIQGAYLGALYQARSIAEFERAYDNAMKNGTGPKAMMGAAPAFKRAFNGEMVALKEKREGVLTKEMATRLLGDWSGGK